MQARAAWPFDVTGHGLGTVSRSIQQRVCVAPPSPSQLKHLQPSNAAGLAATALATLITAGGITLGAQSNIGLWALGQGVLSLAFLQWFVLLHEAGHGTLFRTHGVNRRVGRLAGALALIPFEVWQRIHARHHRYTGWQDLDATTALLVPREVSRLERAAINFAWWTGLPLFSVLYRLQNFWNVPRIARFLGHAKEARRAWASVISLGLILTGLVAFIGPLTLARVAGPGLLLSLAAQDLILLSQHTHMPRHLSGGKKVRPFTPMEQEPFTRSLLLPGWLSTMLMHFDLHELHHLYVRVPGYRLHRIAYEPANQVGWVTWLRAAKRLSGVEFLFGNREQTGLKL